MTSFKYIICYFSSVLSLSVAFAQKEEIKFTYLTHKNGLSSNMVNAIIKDRYGLMWFATEDGLNKFDGTNFTVYRHKVGDTTGLQSNDILTLYEDKAGNLWVGCNRGGLCLYDRQMDSFINFKANLKSGGISHENVRTVCGDHFGKIWIGGFNGIDTMDPITKKIYNLNKDPTLPNGLLRKPISFIFEDTRSRMWIGTAEGLFLYNWPTRSFSHFSHSKKGNIFIGTDGGKLNLFDKKTGLFTHYNIKPKGNPPLSELPIFCLEMAKNNQLFIGTYSKGLFILDPVTGLYEQLTSGKQSDELTSNDIFAIREDHEGRIWIGTNGEGINVLDAKSHKIVAKYCSSPKAANEYLWPINGYIRSFWEDKNQGYHP